jgi:hypothetical protein
MSGRRVREEDEAYALLKELCPLLLFELEHSLGKRCPFFEVLHTGL